MTILSFYLYFSMGEYGGYIKRGMVYIWLISRIGIGHIVAP